jgi:glycosyltransferase involved in cell wall biosynthesis
VNNLFDKHEIDKSGQPGQAANLRIVFFSRSTDDALSMLRVLGPADASRMTIVRGLEDGAVQSDRINEADLVVIQRDFCRDLDGYEKIRDLAHAAKKPVVMDIDDLLFELPPYHPDRINYYYTDALLPMLQAVIEADLVTVPTPKLRDQLAGYNKHIKVFANYLIDKWWSMNEPPRRELQDTAITIGYMGGPSHQPDLASILPILANIVIKYKPKIKFHFWGIKALPELAEYSEEDWFPPKSYAYRDFAFYFQTQSADIMIAPLLDSLFNRCKSCIKYLEYSALGVPGVYSRVAPYEGVIEDGVNGLLAATPEEWGQALSRLIENPGLRRELAINAQKAIKSDWLLSQHAAQLRKIYAEALQDYPVQSHPLPPYYGALKTLTRQAYEGSQRISQLTGQKHHLEENILQLDENIHQLNENIHQLNENIHRLEDQIHQKTEENNQLSARLETSEEENIDYALSTSWLVTRPMRRISGKLKGIR